MEIYKNNKTFSKLKMPAVRRLKRRFDSIASSNATKQTIKFLNSLSEKSLVNLYELTTLYVVISIDIVFLAR